MDLVKGIFMKIKVNYDLIDKIKEQKIGYSLIRTRRDILKFGVMFFPLDVLIANGDIKFLIIQTLFRTGSNAIVFTLIEKYLSKFGKDDVVMQLKALAESLRNHYINTDYELLQNSHQYKTNYRVILDENKIPRLKQEKYIMVPVVDRDGEKEVSLLQEHLIGSNDYELSYGSPSKSKVLKPVFNGI